MKRIFFLLIISIFIAGCSPLTADDGDKTTPSSTEDIIHISVPSPEQKITSPLVVTGEARGYWFFEATAPVLFVDWDGKIIAQSYITAMTENWMTEDFVPFKGTLNFELPETTPYKRGTLIFQKSNPSNLPKNDAAVEIPITFE